MLRGVSHLVLCPSLTIDRCTWAAMNCFRPSTVIPLLSTPLTVGKRGSSLEDEMRKAKRECGGREDKEKKAKRGGGGIQRGNVGQGEGEYVMRGHKKVQIIDTLYILHMTKHQSPNKSN